MLDIRLELSEIDYDRCVELLLPPLVARLPQLRRKRRLT